MEKIIKRILLFVICAGIIIFAIWLLRLVYFAGFLTISDFKNRVTKDEIIDIFVNNEEDTEIVFNYLSGLNDDFYINDDDNFRNIIDDKIVDSIENLIDMGINGISRQGDTVYFEVVGSGDVQGIAKMNKGSELDIQYVVEFEPLEGYEGYYYYRSNFEEYKQGYGVFENQ